MPTYVIGSFLVYCVINAFTPGPGNLLALNTVTNYGWTKGRPLFIGIFSGYLAVQLICCLIVYGIGTMAPGLMNILKYVGAAYILWLAVHIAFSKLEPEDTQSSASFLKGFLLQFVNVKIYMFGITALTGYITDYSTSFLILLFFELVIVAMGILATSCWIGLGVVIQRFYVRHFRVINVILALTLLECIYSMLV